MPATPLSSSYAMSRFQVKVDGHPITSFVKSVEGGLLKTDSATEATGPYHIPLRHITTRTVEPITLEIGMSGTDWVMGILENLINNREHARLSGEVLHGDVNAAERFQQEWTRGLITEVVFPAFDANGKEMAFVKVKIQPEDVDFKAMKSPGPRMVPEKETKQKLWQTNAFRLNLELNGQKIACEHVSKIESISVKVGVKAYQRGQFYLPEYTPTKLEFSKLGVTLPLHYAGDFIDWYRASVTKDGGGTADGSQYEATGSIEWLDPSRTKTLYTMNLMGVAPENFTISKTEGSSNNHKTCKFDLYCTQLKVSKSGLGQ